MIRAIAITGPTASGKTALSIALAKRLSAEIISADSMQIYKRMDIGTAKATPAEQSAVRHHLIDLIEPNESYSVECWRDAAMAAARDITSRSLLPIFVGGTGLYINSLTRLGQSEIPASDPEYRERILEGIKTSEDIDALWQRLNSVDPESASAIHKNNLKRVIRALEIYDKTGIPKTVLDRRSTEGEGDIDLVHITLDFHDRELLYSRIDKRVGMMLEEGLILEVESLYREGMLPKGSTAAQAIGYKELREYLEGTATLDEAANKIRLASRRYAKRQLTWFRHNGGACRVFADKEDGGMREGEGILSECLAIIDEHFHQDI